MAGTPGWRAPEVIKKGGRPGPAADIFSLGLCLLALWFGASLVERARSVCLEQGVGEEHVEEVADELARQGPGALWFGPDARNFWRQSHSREIRALIAKMCSPAADRRPTAAEVGATLRRLVMDNNGEPNFAPPWAFLTGPAFE